jgi:hypothetical protein
MHRSIEDPAMAIGTMDKRVAVFRRVRNGIKAKIEELLRSFASEATPTCINEDEGR